MVKKFGMFLIIFVIIAVFAMPVFAGNTKGAGITGNTGNTGNTSNTSPAIYTGVTVTNSEGTNLPAGNSTGAGESPLNIDGEDAAAASASNDAVAEPSAFEKEYDSALKNGQALDTGETIMVITSPDKDKDSTYKKTYIISGKSSYDDVIISIARLNTTTGEYELIYNTDGEKSWGIGSSGIFSKEIELEKGVNNLMFISYRKSEMEGSKIQFNSVTIELLNESIKDRVLRKATDIKNDITDGLKSFVDFVGGNTK